MAGTNVSGFAVVAFTESAFFTATESLFILNSISSIAGVATTAADPLLLPEGVTAAFVFTEGYLCTKFKNVTSDGFIGKNATFVDTDFPLFRLADVYLMYAEAVKRGGGGDAGLALNYVNLLRERAYGDNTGNIAAGDLTHDLEVTGSDEASRLMHALNLMQKNLRKPSSEPTSPAHWAKDASSGHGWGLKHAFFPTTTSSPHSRC